MNAQTTRYLTVTETAELLKLSEISVRRKIRDGTIPAVRLANEGRGSIRVDANQLERWLDDNRVEPPEAA